MVLGRFNGVILQLFFYYDFFKGSRGGSMIFLKGQEEAPAHPGDA